MAQRSARLAYLDNLKVLLVTGVIAVHAAITYGLDGSWYLESYETMHDGVVGAVTIVLGTGWLFGLGLFFLMAGRLTGPAFDRKGAGPFVRGRLLRLGVPLVVYTFLVSPPLEYVDYRWNGDGTGAFWPFVREQVWHLAPGPTWFLEALLVFSLGYTALRVLRRGVPDRLPRRLAGRHVVAIALTIAAASFATHLAFPVGSEQFHLQLAMFPQYVVLFALGAAAGRRGWLEVLDPRLVRRCGLLGAATALALPAVLALGDFFDGGAAEDRFAGGLHWQAAATSLMEGLIATSLSLWSIGWFQRRASTLGPLASRMAPAAYGAFLVHPPLLVGLAFAAAPLPLPVELKFLLVLALGVATSFAAGALAGRPERARRIVSSAPRPAPAVR